MKFILSEDEVRYCVQNPYSGCYSPVSAAIGRVGEPYIIALVIKELGIEISPPDDPRLPKLSKFSLFSRPKRHDGLIFFNDEFIGINETKIAIEKNFIRIPNHEKMICDRCVDLGLMYLLSYGRCANIKSRECEYLGTVDLAEAIRNNGPSILKPDNFRSDLSIVYLNDLEKLKLPKIL